ncbi:MAG TPA: histidine kinase dimerization/phospho-acceptor domain-containing protein [Longimicrobium sp.]|jgi:hypothetical protein
MPFRSTETAPAPAMQGTEPSPIPAVVSPERYPAVLAVLQRIAERVACPAELGRLLRTLADETGALLHASATTATSEPGDLLALRAGSGILAPFEGELLPGEGSFCGAALHRGWRETIDLAREPHAYPGEQDLGAGPALAAALPAPGGPSGVLLVVRPAGSPPFTAEERAELALVVEFAASALAGARAFAEARARRIPVDAWRNDRDTAAWRRTYDAVAAETGQLVFRVEMATGEIRWGAAGGSWGSTVAGLAQRVAAADRERVVRALTIPGGPARLEVSASDGSGRVKRYRLDTFPDAAEPGTLAALLAEAPVAERGSGVPVAELIRAVRHELNNPLAVVAGTVHLMEASGAADGQPEIARSVQQIRDASDRLRDLSTRIGLLERMPEAAFVTEGGGLGVAIP